MLFKWLEDKDLEKWAQNGRWVIGIGGKNTEQLDRLIYVMEVDKNLTYAKFKKEYPDNCGYLKPKDAGTNVLVSKHFWYFGDRAIVLPKKLAHININRQGCKCVSDKDIEVLTNVN
jgi:Nucleotide modification associated domain 2